MNVTWGSIRSWHALPPTRALVATKALCGRNVPEGERHGDEASGTLLRDVPPHLVEG